MLLLFSLLIALFLTQLLASRARLSRSRPVPSLASVHNFSKLSPRQASTSGNESACNEIFTSGYDAFASLDVYNCLVEVPFNRTVATQFLKYYKDTLEFQSTLTYLKNPPSSYQQPGVDILGGLDRIQRNVDTGVFVNEYQFELEVQNLLFSAHDSHLYLFGGAATIFSFGAPFYISSVSVDGQAPPQVYITGDLLASLSQDYVASPITQVNGQDATAFFTQFAAVNSNGYIEPHADWNNLVYNPAGDVQGLVNAFTGTTPFYPGDVFSITFENGTGIGDISWLAAFNDLSDQVPIASAQDFYNTFVINDAVDNFGEPTKKKRDALVEPVSYWKRQAAAPSATATSAAVSATQEPATSALPSAWPNIAYPQSPIISEVDLGEGGVLTGYILDDGITGVLSIPNFNPENVTSFSATVGGFMTMCQNAGVKKIIIDLQQNYGGIRLLAADTFRQFFPSIEPFAGSRARAHQTADTLGTTYTSYYNTYVNSSNLTYYDYFATSVWTAPVYLDAATGRNFTTWPEYFGPTQDRLDFFTTIQRDNFSSILFDEQNAYEFVYGYGNRTVQNTTTPFAAENIILLTDGLCASTCTLFAEMMHSQAGVRTVVIGGRPEFGPMQALAGTRGARDYKVDYLDTDIFAVETFNDTTNAVLPDRTVEFKIKVANFNLQDQIRSSQNFPLQFIYEAANCRIYLTNLTFFDFGALWKYAGDATWTNPSLCVKDSTDHPSAGNTTDTVGPSSAQKAIWAAAGSPTPVPATNLETSIDLALIVGVDNPDDDSASKAVNKACNPNIDGGGCGGTLVCVVAPFCDPSNGRFVQSGASCQLSQAAKCPSKSFGSGSCNLNGQTTTCQFCKPLRAPSAANCALTKTVGKKVKNVAANVPQFGDFTPGTKKEVTKAQREVKQQPETIAKLIMRGMGG